MTQGSALVLVVTWPTAVDIRKSGLNLLIFHFVALNYLMCFVNVPISMFTVMLKRDGCVVS